jgi:hypothetical protein
MSRMRILGQNSQGNKNPRSKEIGVPTQQYRRRPGTHREKQKATWVKINPGRQEKLLRYPPFGAIFLLYCL